MATQSVNVVHSSLGRLRVHLPDPDGHIAYRIRCLPGVSSAQASKWTENILIKYQPQVTTEATVLAELRFSVDNPPALPLHNSTNEATALLIEATSALELTFPAQPVGYVTGFRRRLYQLLGWASVGLAVVGFIVPGIPGAPFVILAGYFFIRSSPKAHAWLLQSRWFGPILRDWEQHRAVRRSLKLAAVGLIVFAMVFILLIGLPTPLVVTILFLEVVGLIIVSRIRVIESEFQPSRLLASS
jgi:uncharacterized membrane protein YbaN (DUF454 family)